MKAISPVPIAVVLLLLAGLAVWWIAGSGASGSGAELGVDPWDEDDAFEPETSASLTGTGTAALREAEAAAAKEEAERTFRFFVIDGVSGQPVKDVRLETRDGEFLGIGAEDGWFEVVRATPLLRYVTVKQGYLQATGSVTPDRVATLRLHSGVPLAGRVLLGRDQSPVEGAKVEVFDLDLGKAAQSAATTNELGEFAFKAVRPFHPFRIRVTADGVVPFERDDVIVAEDAAYDIVVGLGGSVFGAVRDETGAFAEGAQVFLVPEGSGVPPFATRWPSSKDRGKRPKDAPAIATMRLGEDGAYRFDGIPRQQRVRVVVKHHGRHRAHTKFIRFSEYSRLKPVKQDIQMLDFARARVFVNVIGLGGLERARIDVTTEYDTYRPFIEDQGGGEYLLTGLSPVMSIISATKKPYYGGIRHMLHPDKPTDLTIEIVPPKQDLNSNAKQDPTAPPGIDDKEETTTLVGRFEPWPLPGRPSVLSPDYRIGREDLTFDEQTGTFRLTGPRAGQRVELVFNARKRLPTVVESIPFEGEHDLGVIRFDPIPSCTIVGQLVRPPRSGVVTVEIVGEYTRDPAPLTWDAGGNFVIPGPEVGKWITLIFRSPGFAPELIDVPTLKDGDSWDVKKIYLGEGHILRGRVLGPTKDPALGASVVLEMEGYRTEVRTNELGHFDFVNVPERRGTVKVKTREGFEGEGEIVEQLLDQRPDIELVSTVGKLTGVVRDDFNRPGHGAYVLVTPWFGPWNERKSIRLGVDRHGRFERYLEPGEYRVRVLTFDNGRWDRFRVNISTGKTTRRDISFARR